MSAVKRASWGRWLSALTTEFLHKAQQRKTDAGSDVAATGATVRLNGMRLGQTPIIVTTFAGEHRVEIQKPGFAPYQNEVVVDPGRGAALDALLQVGAQPGNEGPATASASGAAESSLANRYAAAFRGFVAERLSPFLVKALDFFPEEPRCLGLTDEVRTVSLLTLYDCVSKPGDAGKAG